MPVNIEDDEDVGHQDGISRPSQTTDTPSTNIRNRRLGIFQLGLYAHEKAAPAKSLELMEIDAATRIPHMIHILAKASEQDPSIQTTYLCDPSTQYITKTKSEGSLCGYRNIQMMISYIIGRNDRNELAEVFSAGIPSILQIQDLIENAWDKGINSNGRVETGGIRGTRKHIGTPEVQALFKSLGLPCYVGIYSSTSSDVTKDVCSAFCSLLNYVENHFRASVGSLEENKVNITNQSPIYLQRPHHSLTVIGIELRTDGTRNLLVFDPKSRPSRCISRAAETIMDERRPSDCVSLKPFRRGRWSLGLYRQFETLTS